jgi:hypothetical protein
MEGAATPPAKRVFFRLMDGWMEAFGYQCLPVLD